MLKVLKCTYVVLFVMLFMWFCLSYVDIITDNCMPNPIHHPWNMFLLLKG